MQTIQSRMNFLYKIDEPNLHAFKVNKGKWISGPNYPFLEAALTQSRLWIAFKARGIFKHFVDMTPYKMRLSMFPVLVNCCRSVSDWCTDRLWPFNERLQPFNERPIAARLFVRFKRQLFIKLGVIVTIYFRMQCIIHILSNLEAVIKCMLISILIYIFHAI